VALVGVAFATWARQHAPWILDIHAVVPGLLAALIPMFRRSTRIEMSPTALNTFFPARAGGTPAMRT
jgi:hypothetical protein